MNHQREATSGSARVVVTRVFGLFAAAAAAEHGLGEALQGNIAPDGPFIQSWPDAAFFRIEAGEPALTLVPNLLVSGVLTLLLSALFAWRVMARSARTPRLDLILLSVLLLLVGGGFGPPILGLAVAAAASGPEPRRHHGPAPLLAHAFYWILATTVLAWLALVPGLPLLDLIFGTGDAALIPAILAAFTLFPLCVLASRAADAVPRRTRNLQPTIEGTMMKVLVTYATRHGATTGIATRIAEKLTASGHEASALPVEDVTDLDGYQAVVLGGAAYMSHWLKPAVRFARHHHADLAAKPVWLFSSGPIGTDQVDAQGQDVRISTRPKEWDQLVPLIRPRGEAVFFGAYDPTLPPIGLGEGLIRHLPAATSTLPAGDFRDWDAIQDWATQIAMALSISPTPKSCSASMRHR